MAGLLQRARLWAVLSCLLAAPVLQAARSPIVVEGSDTLGFRLMPRLRESYRQVVPEADFELSAEGSSTGIAAVIDGRAHLAMVSRAVDDREQVRAAEQGVALRAVAVAHDAIAIVVHRDNPLAGLSPLEVERIFTGDYRDWLAVGAPPGRISAFIRNPASGTHASFRELAMRQRDYDQHARMLAGNERIADEVEANRWSIGYVGLAYVLPETRIVPIAGVLPDNASVADGSYPYVRPLYFVFDANRATPALSHFLEWVLSPEGQREVRGARFIPVDFGLVSP